MSASNWAICPKCQHQREQEVDDLKAKVAAAYGSVPVEQFDELRAAALALEAEYANPEDNSKLATFREDYAIWGANDGTVLVRYEGGCSKCGTSTKFRYSHPFYDSDAAS